MKRLFLLILIVLSQAAQAQSMTAHQKEIIDKLGVYYRELGLKSKADWLKQEVAAGRIRFGPTEPGETAVTDMPTRNEIVKAARAVFRIQQSQVRSDPLRLSQLAALSIIGYTPPEEVRKLATEQEWKEVQGYLR